jgi:hypothetical protein
MQLFNMESFKVSFILVIVLVLIPFGQRNATADGRWFVSLYGGQATYGSEKDVFTFKADYVDSYIGVFVVGKRLSAYKDYIRIEAEGQIVKHWELQDHFEFNALFVFRWLLFPWDDYLDTSFAIGDGISYATEDPEIEVQKHDKTSKILNYLMFELAFVVPKQPHWSVFARLHHRSGMFGLINGISGGSNAVGAGVRYTF